MKKLIFSAMAVLMAAVTVVSAQDIKVSRVGVHGAYSAGGDVEKGKFGYGAQGELSFSRYVGIELAASQFSDEYADEGIALDQDLTTLGLSLVVRLPYEDKGSVYALGGVDYNLVSMDASLDPTVYSLEGMTPDVSVDVDDAFGFHVGAGVECNILKNLAVFAEYRFTFLDLTGDVTASLLGHTATENIDGSYNFGLAKIGLNYRF